MTRGGSTEAREQFEALLERITEMTEEASQRVDELDTEGMSTEEAERFAERLEITSKALVEDVVMIGGAIGRITNKHADFGLEEVASDVGQPGGDDKEERGGQEVGWGGGIGQED